MGIGQAQAGAGSVEDNQRGFIPEISFEDSQTSVSSFFSKSDKEKDKDKKRTSENTTPMDSRQNSEFVRNKNKSDFM